MEQFNEFQKSTEAGLKELLAAIGCDADFGVDGGPDEFAVKVTTGKYTSWIVPDGAVVGGEGIDKCFEIYDYDSLDDLQSAFLAFMKDLLSSTSCGVV